MEVGKRYVEQIQTTVEVMRRRLVAAYDLGIKVGQRSKVLAEQALEYGESAAFDWTENLIQACNETGKLDPKDKETRNNLVELYLGISVMLIGASAGQLSGASILAPLFAFIFNPFLEASLLFMLPIYVYLSFRKNAAFDETERRVWIFGLSFLEGAILGHLVGIRLIRAVPAIFFSLPLVFALLTDYEISPSHLYSDRNNLLAACALIGGGLSLVISSAVMHLSIGVFLMTIAHLAILFIHFQLVVYGMKNKNYGVSEAQISYMLSLMFVQLIISVIFISGNKNQ